MHLILLLERWPSHNIAISNTHDDGGDDIDNDEDDDDDNDDDGGGDDDYDDDVLNDNAFFLGLVKLSHHIL